MSHSLQKNWLDLSDCTGGAANKALRNKTGSSRGRAKRGRGATTMRPQEVHILSAICMDLLIMVMNRCGISLFSSCDKPTGPKH